jgi:membrane protease YdiL (CAAX protease family)
VSPIVEEILFRGLVLNELTGLLPRRPANMATSLLFVAIHLPFWLSRSGLTAAVLADSVGVLVFSLLAGWLYQQSRSIWPSAVAHIANNCLAAALVVNR